MNQTPNQVEKDWRTNWTHLAQAVRHGKRLMIAERILWTLTWQAVARGMALALVVWWDAMWNWSVVARAVFAVGLVIWCASVAGWAGWVAWRGVGDVEVARRLERVNGITGDRLVCPVELLSAEDARSASLVAMAAGEADELAKGLSTWRMISAGTWCRLLVVAFLALGCLAVISWRMPGMIEASWSRFAMAREDHAPYTKLGFEVHVDDHGIRVKVTGGQANAADVVWVGKDGSEIRSPMMKIGSAANGEEFGLDLAGEPESEAFYVDTPGGRSQRVSTAGMKRNPSTGAQANENTGRSGSGNGQGAGHGDPMTENGATNAGVKSAEVNTGAESATSQGRGTGGEKSGGVIEGVSVVAEKRETTTRAIGSDMGHAKIEDVPARYRWLVERYEERK